MPKQRRGQKLPSTDPAKLRKRLPKDYHPLLDAAVAVGARLKEKRDGIVVATAAGTVMLHSTPSVRRRSLENTRAELKRIGVVVDGPPPEGKASPCLITPAWSS